MNYFSVDFTSGYKNFTGSKSALKKVIYERNKKTKFIKFLLCIPSYEIKKQEATHGAYFLL